MNLEYITSFAVDETTYMLYRDEERFIHLMRMVDIDDNGERHEVLTPVADAEKEMVIKALEESV